MAEKYPLVLNGTNIEELQSGDSIAGAIDSVSEDTSPSLGGNLNTGSYNVSFGDGAKALFGASNDLQIFHDGSNSYIIDNGTGNLLVRGININLQSTSGEDYINCTDNGGVTIRYDNSSRLTTTSTGVSVNGNVTATSFSGDGSNLTGISATNRYFELNRLDSDSNQSMSSGTFTKNTFVREIDPYGICDLSNNRIIPNVAGYYYVSINLYADTDGSSDNRALTQITKNGSGLSYAWYGPMYDADRGSGSGGMLVYCNGTTDYLEMQSAIWGSGARVVHASIKGFLVEAD